MTRERPLLLTAEVGLAAITVTVVLGMSRLFTGGGWLGPLLISAVAAHAVAALTRRQGLSLAVTGVVMLGSGALLATWTLYGPTTAYGIPTGETVALMRTDLANAWSLYQTVVAPAPVETGFVLASAIALWLAAFIADWAAFRLWVPFEATLATGTLFLFTALLGAETGRGWTVGLFAGACLAFFLLHRLARQDRTSHWVAGRAAQGHRWLLAAGLALGTMAVIAGSLLGPVLPGADAVGVVNPRGLRASEGSRLTISPLVDIRTRLVDQRDTVAFRVRSSRPAYWRLTSLDRFDGTIWSSSGTYGKARGSLPEAQTTKLPTDTFDQSFTIGALAAIWLPSAYEPRAVSATSVGVLYDERSATLIVDRDVETSDGLTYDVTSSAPRITAADLERVDGTVSDDLRNRFRDLPADFSPRVAQLARDLTAKATTPYQQALSLQRHLRSFTYDLRVGPGHSDAVLERFLFDTKRGYCEQFAGAFAAMARSLGLPARVAVGFTQGVQDPADPGVFVVRGEHAHAWPEVYLAGAGWVSFEPTPGRGQPFAEDYTGVPVAQASTTSPGSATTSPPTTATNPSATIPSASSQPKPGDNEATTGTNPDAGANARPSVVTRFAVRPLRIAAPYAGAILAVYLLAFPGALILRRHLRRRRASSTTARIWVAWCEALEEARLIGYWEVPSDTWDERATRLAALFPEAGIPEHARRMARSLEMALYAEGGADDLDAVLAEESGAAVAAAARAAASIHARVQRWLDPRPWLRAGLGMLRREARITSTAPADLEAEHARELVESSDRR